MKITGRQVRVDPSGLVVVTTTDVQAALAELDAAVDALIDAGPGGGSGAAADITFTPAGTIAATDVQAAIEEVAAEAGTGGGGGGGGGAAAWTQVVDETLLDSDTTGWTSDGGTWTQDSSGFHVAASGLTFRRRFTDVQTVFETAVVEVEIRLDSGSGNAGIAFGSNSGGNGTRVDLRGNGTDVTDVGYEVDMQVAQGTTPLSTSIPYGTWIPLRVEKQGRFTKTWVNDVLIGVKIQADPGGGDFALCGYNVTGASFRNLKVWTPLLDETSSGGGGALDVLTADPASPVAGYEYYNSTTDKLRIWTGALWASTTFTPELPYGETVLADDPWGYWRLTETSGTTLQDETAHNRDLTIVGSAHTLDQTGPRGKAITWAAAAGRADDADNFTSSTVTMECWAYLTANPGARTAVLGMAESFNSGTSDKNLFVDTDGKAGFYWYLSGAAEIKAPTALALDEWHHLAASVGPAGMFLYVDGEIVATYAATTTYTGNQLVFLRGGGNVGGGMNGAAAVRTAEPAVYTTQLSPTRIAAHYDAVTG